MIISLVVAASENNVIGNKNQLVWSLPNDTKFFKNTTWAMPIIMGRKTFESLNSKPLNGRFNIIITRNPQALNPISPIHTETTLAAAIEKAKETDAKEVFIIGGGEIYKDALPMASKIILTRVHTIIEGDTYFPEFSEEEWQLTSNMDFVKDEKHVYAYSFQVWERKKQVLNA